MKKIHVYLSIAVLAGLTACKKEPAAPPGDPAFEKAENGVVILNEGISDQTSSIDFYSRVQDIVFKDIYKNGGAIGTPVQSMAFSGDEGFIVVSGAAKIYVVDQATFSKRDSITGFELPRYMLPVNDSIAYVTDWYTDESIVVVNTKTRSIVKKLMNGNKGPERLLMAGGKVVVVNQGIWNFSTNSFDADSTITVIDPVSHTITAIMTLAAQPSSLQVDKNGLLWVMCAGIPDYATPANGTPAWLYKIDPASLLVLASHKVGGNEDHPFQLTIDGSKSILAWFYGDKIFKFHTDSLTLPAAPFIQGGNYYNLAIDPQEDVLYVSDPKNYTQNGTIFRYDLNTGALIGSFEGGIAPGNFYFR